MARKRLTLAQQAYEELQDQILIGTLAPGQRLLPTELAERLEISETPVKEALAELQRDGLIVGEVRRASVVRRFTPKDMQEIYQARILLELFGIREGFARNAITPGFVVKMEELFHAIVHRTAQHTREGLADAIRLDCEFHELLVTLANNPIISSWHRAVLRQYQTARNYSFETYPLDSTRSGHGAIFDAVKSGDQKAAEAALLNHLEGARDEMLARPESDRPVRTPG